MQNAIDACRLRKIIEKNDYDPEILIEITDNYIQFKDNGIGMNEFEIKNYFSQIGSSIFYNNKEVLSFNSIGIFGMGILSYFMICDTFEILTKKKTSNLLWFRVDKISDLNFLFYDKEFEMDQGTIVKIPINRSLHEVFNYYNLREIIKSFFVNLEVLVRIDISNILGHIASVLKFKPDFQKKDLNKLSGRIPFSLEKKPKTIEIEHLTIEEDEIEGELYTFYSLNDKGGFKSLAKYNQEIGVRVFQNNMYIQTIESKNLYVLGGYLNFKKEQLEINLNKTAFLSSLKLQEIIQNYEIQLLNKLFNKFIKSDMEENHNFSIEFYKKIFRGRSFYPNSRSVQYYDFFKETLFPYRQKFTDLNIVKLKDIIEDDDKFILAPIIGATELSNNEDLEELEKLSIKYNKNIIIPFYETLLLYLEWIYNNQYSIKILGGSSLPYLFVDTSTKNEHYKLFNEYLVLEFEDPWDQYPREDINEILFSKIIGSNNLFLCIFNEKHPLVNFLIKNENNLDEAIILMIGDFCSEIKNTDLIVNPRQLYTKYANIINQLNRKFGTDFSDELF